MKNNGIVLLILFVLSFTVVKAQYKGDYYNEIRKYDCSKLWCTDSVINLEVIDDTLYLEPQKFCFPEPLGFIGDNFQRFYVHFSLVVRDQLDPLVYHVTGKTRVKGNICSLTGTMTIAEVRSNIDKTIPAIVRKRGTLRCVCVFYEDSAQKNSGIIKGEMITNWCLYKKELAYDNINFVADGYCNNQFTGTWKPYSGGVAKQCNWGDYRIPGSRDLDMGTGEFSVAPKYIKNGWANVQDTLVEKWWR